MKSTAQNTIENSPINADHANLSTLPAIRESSVASNLATDLDQDSIATSSGPLKIPFTPGDHITRWEMLPIAWPIQVHGIVLEVFTDSIVLVDFGLAAVLDPTVEAKEGANADSEGSEITQENNKKQLKVKRAIESFQKSLKKKKEKQRLNVRTLTEQKEISKWSKVNYDGGLFRFGGGDEKKDDTIASSDGSTVEEKGDSWWSSWKKSQPQENPKPFGRNEDSDSPRNTKADDNTSEKLKGESSRASWWSRLSSKRDMKAEVEDSLRSRSQPDDRDSKLGDVLYPVGNDDAAGNDTINLAMELERRYMREQHGAVDAKQNESLAAKADHSEEEKHVDSKSKEDIFWSKNDLIQADTAIVENDPSEEKKEDEEVFADVGKKNFEEAVLEPTVEVETKEIVVSKQKRKLSRADPAKLVLARTNWLLKHGESILPPYHAFSSNSECMAVFCKTGYWSTLQADIFLHSTAIGNAKSTVVMTLGVAASVPVLAPVVGLAGLGAIAAPWLYLRKNKNAAEETQHKLTDSFWQQAEPEVFIECIREWSHMAEQSSKTAANDGGNVEEIPMN